MRRHSGVRLAAAIVAIGALGCGGRRAAEVAPGHLSQQQRRQQSSRNENTAAAAASRVPEIKCSSSIIATRRAHLHRWHAVRVAERLGGAREKRLVLRMERLGVDRALQENGLFV